VGGESSPPEDAGFVEILQGDPGGLGVVRREGNLSKIPHFVGHGTIGDKFWRREENVNAVKGKKTGPWRIEIQDPLGGGR